MCIATLLDVLGQKLAMEIIAYCVIDEAPRFLLGLSRLIFEYDIVVPPSLHGETPSATGMCRVQ